MRLTLSAVLGFAMLLVAVPGGTADAGTVAAVDLQGLQNQLRYQIGAPTIAADPRLVAAATNHASYSSLNGTGGHYETAGLPGYTGYAPRDRVVAAGWAPAFVSEVATGGADALAALRSLWDAPYHRLGMMHPHNVAVGWGHSDLNGRGSTVGNFVYDFGSAAPAFVRSPGAGQTSVPTSWNGRESPSPLPAGVSGPVGYPIMVVYSGAQRVDMRAAELVAPGGARLPIYYVPQQFEYDYQVIIPRAPLVTNTTYHVRFDITVNGRWVTNEWDFSTGATLATTSPVSEAPASAAPADSGYHSRWVSESAFPTLGPGQTSAPLTLVFANVGSRPWVRGVLGQQANLGVNLDDRSFAGLGIAWPTPDRVAIQSEPIVNPGSNATFTFQVRAPLAPGVYAIHLRPVIDGTAWMEDEGVYLLVSVR